MSIQSKNPATSKVEKEFSPYSKDQINQSIKIAHITFKSYCQSSFDNRAKKMNKAAEILENRKEEFATLMVREMGKTFIAAQSEVEKCASVCRHYADNAENYLADRHIETEYQKSYVSYKPIGIVLAIMPWNFPFWQVFRFAAPTLMAGNVGLLKHASNVPQCAIAIQKIFEEAGFEKGCFQTLLIGSDKIEDIIKDDRIRAVTLTGSEKAGRAVAKIAGENLKKCVLELGGSDPFIVMPSAKMDDAINDGVTGRTMNNGQSCIAAKRFIIHEDIYDEYKSKLIKKFENLTVGNPMNEDTDIGPMVMKSSREDLDEQVSKTIKSGAALLTGAHIIEGEGYYYQPGILENIPKDSIAYKEELFGPVALLFKVKNLEEAIELANSVRFGLGSAIYTNNQDEMNIAIRDLDYGSTFINHIVASDPRLPFGGVKDSGYGRELAEDGIREFMNLKTIVQT